MGADNFVGFYGIKIPLDAEDEEEQEACATGVDARCIKAHAARLETYMGRMTNGEDYFVYIGTHLTSIGLEGDAHQSFKTHTLVSRFAEVDRRLIDAGFRDEPALHFQLVAQY